MSRRTELFATNRSGSKTAPTRNFDPTRAGCRGRTEWTAGEARNFLSGSYEPPPQLDGPAAPGARPAAGRSAGGAAGGRAEGLADGVERRVGVLAEGGDRGDAHHDDQRQHHRVLDGGRAVLALQEVNHTLRQL